MNILHNAQLFVHYNCAHTARAMFFGLSVVVSCGQLWSVVVSCGQLWSVVVSQTRYRPKVLSIKPTSNLLCMVDNVGNIGLW